jgi:hypothetical protein
MIADQENRPRIPHEKGVTSISTMNLLKKREGGSDVGATTAEETGRRIRLRGASIRFTTCPAPALITSMEASLRERRKHRDESRSKRPIICRGEAKEENNYNYQNPDPPPTRCRPPWPPATWGREAGGEIWGGGQGKDDTASSLHKGKVRCQLCCRSFVA